MKKENNNKIIVNKKRLLDNFFNLLKIKSPTKNERELAIYLKSKLEELGLSTFIDDVEKNFGGSCGNLIAKYTPKKAKNNPPIFLCAHMDTVNFEGEIIPELNNDGIIKNKNNTCILGADDKAAIAAILEALNLINDYGIETGTIYLIFTVGEETALLGSKYIDLNLIDAKIGFVFDADGDVGSIINKAPYHNRIHFTVIGKAAHAGVAPEKGINSIKAASLAISNIYSGRVDNKTTCNIGVINGGIETNIVPEKTSVKAEARSLEISKLNEITNKMIEEFKKAAKDFRAKVEYELNREYDGYEIDENSICVKIAKNAIKKIGREPLIKSSGGGSDTNNFNSKGKYAINLSAGIENCHSQEEYIKFSELVKLTELIVEICRFDEEDLL